MSPILEIKINEVDHFKTKVSTVFEMKTIKNIQECLCKNQNHIAFLFRKMHLLDMSMWFKLENKVCRFFMEESALVSGLTNTYNIDGNGSTRLYKELMDGLKRCTTSKLEDLFMNSTLTNNRKIVKVVMFYFLKFVLLRNDPKIKVQPKHVRHMDNIEDFNSYS